MTKKTYDKEKWLKEKEEKMEKAKDLILEELESFSYDPKELAQYLAFAARFYKYSVNNVILLKGQNANSLLVGSFKKWKELGYSVKKGENGYVIFAPSTVSKYKNNEGFFVKYEKLTKEEKSKVKSLEKKSEIFFVLTTVFDISQTDVPEEDYPKLLQSPLNDVVDNDEHDFIMKKLQNFSETQEILVDYKDLGLIKGKYFLANHSITLNSKNSKLQNIKTLLHELGHALLHNVENKKAQKYSKKEKEFQAEMVAYTVSSALNLDVKEYSLQYIYSWSAKDIKDKEQLLKDVQKVSSTIISFFY